MCSKLSKIGFYAVLPLFTVCVPALATTTPTCLVGKSIVVGEGYAPRLSDNGEVVAYKCNGNNSICITDFSTLPPTVEQIDPEDLPNHAVSFYDISDDGQLVLYNYTRSSSSYTLELYDRTTGQSSTLLSNQSVDDPQISGNGQYVVFRADDGFLATDSNGYSDIVRYNIGSGAMELVTLSSTGAQGNDESGGTRFSADGFDISDDGNVVVFESYANNLISNDNNDRNDVFLRDISAGVTLRVGISTQGQELYYGAEFPRVSGDGKITTFSSYNANYAAERHLFAYDRDSGSVERVAPTIDGNDIDGPTVNGGSLSLSRDGRFVYFQSRLDNLVAGSPEQDYYADAFVFDRDNRQTRSLNYTSIAPEACTSTFPDASESIDGSSDGEKVVQWVVPEEGQPGVIVLSTLPDTNPPRVEFSSSPAQPTTLSQIQLVGGQIDDVATSDLAEYRIDGRAWQPFPVSKNSSQWAAIYEDQFAANSLGLTGHHQVCMRAYDARGNVGSTCEDLEILPEAPTADDIIVQCMHEPVWPQPGDTVTVTATAYRFDPTDGLVLFNHGFKSDGSEGVIDRQTLVDSLEIWVNDNSQPASASSGSGSSFSHSFPATGTDSAPYHTYYGCRIHKGAEVAFSGWKLFGIGDYPHSRAIPIQKSTFPERAIDLVFIADEDDYSSASDPEFLDDVYRLLKYGYWNHTDFLKDQHRYNFWLARDMGDAKRGTTFNDEKCAHRLPSSPLSQSPSGLNIADIWLRHYQFADTAAIVHTERFRDCAPYGRNVFSVGVEELRITFEDSDLDVVRHETAHRPFGLSDEYCCDGGYQQSALFPNVYEEREDCEADVAVLGRVPSDCREFIEDDLFDTDWYVSDPADDDLTADHGDIRANDKRRIDWFYDLCEAGKC